jgi:hypothetical protein
VCSPHFIVCGELDTAAVRRRLRLGVLRPPLLAGSTRSPWAGRGLGRGLGRRPAGTVRCSRVRLRRCDFGLRSGLGIPKAARWRRQAAPAPGPPRALSLPPRTGDTSLRAQASR